LGLSQKEAKDLLLAFGLFEGVAASIVKSAPIV
jgi:hypothetical protein